MINSSNFLTFSWIVQRGRVSRQPTRSRVAGNRAFSVAGRPATPALPRLSCFCSRKVSGQSPRSGKEPLSPGGFSLLHHSRKRWLNHAVLYAAHVAQHHGPGCLSGGGEDVSAPPLRLARGRGVPRRSGRALAGCAW